MTNSHVGELRSALEAARVNEASIRGALESARRKLGEAQDYEAMVSNLALIGQASAKETSAARHAVEEAAGLLAKFEAGAEDLLGTVAKLEAEIGEAELAVHLDKQAAIRAEYRRAVVVLLEACAAFEQANVAVWRIHYRAAAEIPATIHGRGGTVAQGAGLPPIWNPEFLLAMPRSLENANENGLDALRYGAGRYDLSLLEEGDPVRVRLEASLRHDEETRSHAELLRSKRLEAVPPREELSGWEAA